MSLTRTEGTAPGDTRLTAGVPSQGSVRGARSERTGLAERAGRSGGRAAAASDPRWTDAAPATPSPAARPWWALAVLMLPVLLVSVDNTVLSFAIPQLSRSLEPSSAQLLWLVDVYPLVLAALLVPMGVAADRWGRRRMLLTGAAGFAAVSALAAFAPSAGALIAARAGMGLF